MYNIITFVNLKASTLKIVNSKKDCYSLTDEGQGQLQGNLKIQMQARCDFKNQTDTKKTNGFKES